MGIPNSDEAIASRIRAGDTATFDALVSEYFPALVRFATTLTHNPAVAEDAVQTIFVRLWASHERWNPATGVRAYLFRAVRNQVLNDLARAHTEDRFRESGTFEEVVERPDTSAQIEHAEQLRALQAVLAAFPERRRSAIRLRFEEELPYAEIATILGISEKAAQELVSRAIGTLRARLKHLR